MNSLHCPAARAARSEIQRLYRDYLYACRVTGHAAKVYAIKGRAVPPLTASKADAAYGAWMRASTEYEAAVSHLRLTS